MELLYSGWGGIACRKGDHLFSVPPFSFLPFQKPFREISKKKLFRIFIFHSLLLYLDSFSQRTLLPTGTVYKTGWLYMVQGTRQGRSIYLFSRGIPSRALFATRRSSGSSKYCTLPIVNSYCVLRSTVAVQELFLCARVARLGRSNIRKLFLSKGKKQQQLSSSDASFAQSLCPRLRHSELQDAEHPYHQPRALSSPRRLQCGLWRGEAESDGDKCSSRH